MPTYEYRCPNGHEFEQFQRMSEEPLRVCTVCGGPAERIMSTGAGLLFKGSGFYITDYRSDSYRKAADADSGASAPRDAPGDKTAAPAKDSAPAAKDATKQTGGSSGSKASKDE